MNVEKELDILFQMYSDASSIGDNLMLQEIVGRARKIEGRAAILWHAGALQCDAKKWFVAWIYASKPVPKKLMRAFVRSALETPDASRNRVFIEPVLQTYGTEKTKELVSEVSESNDNLPADAKEKAMYWADRAPRDYRGM